MLILREVTERRDAKTKILELISTQENLTCPALLQVHYVERVNAELHELLERYEGEFFQHQVCDRDVGRCGKCVRCGDEERDAHAPVKQWLHTCASACGLFRNHQQLTTRPETKRSNHGLNAAALRSTVSRPASRLPTHPDLNVEATIPYRQSLVVSFARQVAAQLEIDCQPEVAQPP